MSGVISNHPGESVRTITYLEFGLLVVTLASTLFYVTLQSILFLYRYLYFIFAFTLMKFLWGEYTSELRGGTRKCSNTVSMDGKTVVMTGGTTGTGRAAATELASRGARVILGCRDLKKADGVVQMMKKRSCNDDIVTYHLDLSSFKSVREFADKVRREAKRIDVLINNAYISDFESHNSQRIPHSTVDGLTQSFQINYWSHFLLSNLLLPLLVKTPSSRIINVTARLHTKPTNLNFTAGDRKLRYPRLTGYPLGKLANVLFTRELSLRLDGSGVKVYAVDPGLTFWNGHKFTDWKATLLLPVLWLIMSSEYAAAQTTIYCATEKGLQNGEVYFDCRPSKYVSQLVDDDVIREKLWDVSLEVTQLNHRKNGKTGT